jgi:hypothetical protein
MARISHFDLDFLTFDLGEWNSIESSTPYGRRLSDKVQVLESGLLFA